MEIKKNPRQQLENFSKIFFQIGIVLTLFIIHIMLEHKTYENDYSNSLGVVTMVDEMQEDIPIVTIKEVKPPPKQPIAIIEQVKVVEDELKIEETVVQSTETDENESVTVNTEDIVEVEEIEEVVEDVPFMLIEKVPIFPGCKGDNSALKKCFSKGVQKHFSKKFDPGLSTELGLSEGKKKLYVVFRINKNGDVVNVKARGPHPRLEKEVIDIISSLPKMIPGKQRGTAVPVSYSIPITFKVVL